MDGNATREAGGVSAHRWADVVEAHNEPAFDHLAELARLSLDVPVAAVSIVDGGQRRAFAEAGFRPTGLPCEGPLFSSVLATGSTTVVEDAANDPLYRHDPCVAGQPGIRALLAAPLMLQERPVGAIFAADTRPRTFDATARRLIENLAACAVREIELHLRASQDDLTGFLTRNAFLARLRSMHEEHTQIGRKSVLAFLDLDHFKTLNDRFGHAAGDKVLRVVAMTCREDLGPDAFFGRIGGEEFGIALPDHGLDRAVRKLERLRLRIAALSFGEERGLKITGSFGVLGAEPGDRQLLSVWLQDGGTLRSTGSKHAGRNHDHSCSRRARPADGGAAAALLAASAMIAETPAALRASDDCHRRGGPAGGRRRQAGPGRDAPPSAASTPGWR